MLTRLLTSKDGLSEAIRYLIASVIALLADTFTLLTLHKLLNIDALISAGIGFTLGIFVIYTLSTHYVFKFRRLKGQPKVELLWFWISGLIGLILTIVGINIATNHLNLSLLIAKVATAGFVFTFNYIFRKFVMFTNLRD